MVVNVVKDTLGAAQNIIDKSIKTFQLIILDYTYIESGV